MGLFPYQGKMWAAVQRPQGHWELAGYWGALEFAKHPINL